MFANYFPFIANRQHIKFPLVFSIRYQLLFSTLKKINSKNYLAVSVILNMLVKIK